MRNGRKILGIITSLAVRMGVIILLLIVIYIVGRTRAYYYDQQLIKPIAEKLNIDPSWDAFHRHIKESFTQKMSRKDVFEELERFGHYKIHGTTDGQTDDGRVRCTSVEMLVNEHKRRYFFPPHPQYVFCFSTQDNQLNFVTIWPG